ncbi:metallophosphoesterase family protein [Prosthecobacter dejongeii]|uniref:3',5'-cyclic AMP phosphodiesterase CpdA n=1 Tax=Prosthecobacter dejongeii TaxID=48465 RepID=A0A7W7YPW1_9BACT|nr:metallophosphoesterase [Prosthecobacter dejongeii]MBB5040150.1 3',5'-cyclic AMP phosphodiesterase CpdA [Prosthecobacter dejongeii]
MPSLSRRHFLGTALAAPVIGASASSLASPRPSSFEFVFLTDPHIQPELGAVEGVKQCFAKVNEMKPAFVVTGGDLIMDALAVGEARLHRQWELWDEVMKTLQPTAYHTIGNHDVCGWSPKSVLKNDHADYGKKLFADRYGTGRTYRSFDHGGWHFILLDSIALGEDGGYKGWIDDAQLAWLQGDLEKVGRQTPITLVTHIPFYSVWHQVIQGPQITLGLGALVGNVREFRKLLAAYNLRLVLSGHGHISERIQFDQVTYLQGGAVSGMWWKGPVHGNPEGFVHITCHQDGSFEDRYIGYDWAPRR